jgi:MFS family permease
VLLFAGLTAFCAWVAISGIAGSLAVLTAVLFTGTVAAAMLGSANGALMATVEPGVRGRAGGWCQAGNIGAGSLFGGALICPGRALPCSPLPAGIIFVPALTVLWSTKRHPRLPPKPLFTALFRDVWRCSPPHLARLVFFCHPPALEPSA